MNNIYLILTIFALISVSCLSCNITKKTKKSIRCSDIGNYLPSNGYVPDEETAKKIAEAIWVPIYGENKIQNEKPFDVELIGDSIWVVTGTLPKCTIPDCYTMGGTAYIEIDKKTCKILKVIHGK